MPSDLAIRAVGVTKTFRIRHQDGPITLAESMLHRLRHPFDRAPSETFTALDGIDLEVRRGEIMGLIGRNGAGKSTLFKVLSRITPPTAGRIEVFGRIGSLLEVGTGFHPELTGRENVYLNGAILGMRRHEIDRQFDAIVEFAGVERFLDTPVKRYSSGMYVRLAFAVAAHLETEILIVDEVLAVGDAEFQEKCIGQMRSVRDSGRTVLLVSHNLPVIEAISNRCALLSGGKLTVHEPAEAVHRYTDLHATTSAERRTRRPNAPVSILRAQRIGTEGGGLERTVEVEIELDLRGPVVAFVGFGINLSTDSGVTVAAGMVMVPTEGRTDAEIVARLAIPVSHLAPGRYFAELNAGTALTEQGFDMHDSFHHAFSFEQHATPNDHAFDQRRRPAEHGYLRLTDLELEWAEPSP